MSTILTQDNPSCRQSQHKLATRCFYLWGFVLLGRPQDLFPALAPLRPALILCVLTLFIHLFSYPAVFSRLSLKNKQIRLFVYLFCVMILGIPFSLYVRRSFNEVLTSYTSTVLFFLLFYSIVAGNHRRLKSFLFLGACASGLYATFSLFRGVSIARFSFGNMFDANDLAYFAISFLPFNFLFLSKHNSPTRRLISTWSLLASVLLILLTGSRGGFIAFVAVMSILLLMPTRTISKSMKIAFVALCLIFLVLGSFKIDFSRYQTLGSLKDDYNVQDEYGRLAIWETGLRLMLSNPFTGIGVGCFGEAIGKDRELRKLPPKWQAAHSSFVQIGVETGMPGLILFIATSFSAFSIFIKTRKKGPSEDVAKISEMAFVAFLGNLIAGAFLSQAYSSYWAFFIALSAAMLNFTEETEKDHRDLEPQFSLYSTHR